MGEKLILAVSASFLSSLYLFFFWGGGGGLKGNFIQALAQTFCRGLYLLFYLFETLSLAIFCFFLKT